MCASIGLTFFACSDPRISRSFELPTRNILPPRVFTSFGSCSITSRCLSFIFAFSSLGGCSITCSFESSVCLISFSFLSKVWIERWSNYWLRPAPEVFTPQFPSRNVFCPSTLPSTASTRIGIDFFPCDESSRSCPWLYSSTFLRLVFSTLGDGSKSTCLYYPFAFSCACDRLAYFCTRYISLTVILSWS